MLSDEVDVPTATAEELAQFLVVKGFSEDDVEELSSMHNVRGILTQHSWVPPPPSFSSL